MPSSTTPSVPAGIVSELLTLPQVATLCGVSQRTVWGWARDGIAPSALKIGKHTVRYSRAAYLAWCAGGCPRVGGGLAV